MSQQKYTEDKLCKEALPKLKDEVTQIQTLPYRSLVGALMYLAIAIRPDIAYAVSVLSRFNESYGKPHAANRVLRYLKGTSKYQLVFKRNTKDLAGVVDFDWANDVDDRTSYTGSVFKLAGTAIVRESKKQKSVALSSMEAEYMALTEAAKEATYLNNFFTEL
ncbi:secreted RxLR effector protein 161-like [Colletes gigas]|uniref:secreted RxLR effector protein 161-like n=1 Tax=Colletes gigas TaxID=935657 RepID=UPI001C9BAD11|nr:secreted RxLR effector protein 161-like [Colletes gigas]